MYIHDYPEWWNFTYDASLIINNLASVRACQGRLLGELSAVGFSFQNEAVMTNLSLEIVKSSEIEGEILNYEMVRSSVAQRLGLSTLKSAIAHLWFVTIHPFDDGNGRIARALTEMLLSRADSSSRRFYSMSNQIHIDKNNYYNILESTQKGDGDITHWLLWFIDSLDKSINAASETLSSVLMKTRFWESHSEIKFNERQRKLINMLFDGFLGNLNTSKWAKIAKCSADTALNDINDLIAKDVLKKNEGAGKNTSYSLK